MTRTTCPLAFVLDIAARHRCPAHGHPCTELVYSRGSEGTLHQGGKTFAYRDGSVFVYQPGVTHFVVNDTPGTHLCVGVAGAGAERLKPGVIAGGPAVADRFAEFAAAMQHHGPTRSERLDLLAGLLVVDLLDVQGPCPEDDSHAHRARQIIESHLHDQLDVSMIAQQVYVSPDYLRQLFRAEFGESILHYIIRRRIEFARTLLESTALTVAEIAADCGYPNPYYFSRMFRKVTGTTPTEHRAAAQLRRSVL